MTQKEGSHKNGVLVCRATLDEIGVFLRDGNNVYVGERYPLDDKTPLVAAGMENQLNQLKLGQYRHHGITELLVVVIPSEMAAGTHKALFANALQQYNSGDGASPVEAAKNLRAKAKEIVMVYKLCVEWLAKTDKSFDAPFDSLDPDLAGFIRQFADTSVYLYKSMERIIRRYLAGDSTFVEALKKMNMPDDVNARRGLKCSIELLEIAREMGLGEFDVGRLTNLFFLGFFMDCGLWHDQNIDGHAARGAHFYNQLRILAPELPDIGHYIAEHGNITAQTPFVYRVAIKDADGEDANVAYQYHSLPNGFQDIRASTTQILRVLGTNPIPEFEIQRAEGVFATDLTCLSLADRMVNEQIRGLSAAKIVDQMARELNQPHTDYNFAKELPARPTLYSRTLGAVARAHRLMPRGAVVILREDDPEKRKVVRHIGLDGGLALVIDPDKGLWLFGHKSLPENLLPEPLPETVTEAVSANNSLPNQRLILFFDPVNSGMFRNKAYVSHFLPDNIFCAWMTHRAGLIAKALKNRNK